MYFCAIPSSSPVQNELSLTTPNFHYSFWNFRSQIEKQKLYFTIRFGTSVPKSKSGSHISLFVLELPFPNRKAEVIFHCSFWNFRSRIEKRKLICHNLLWNKSKNRALFVLELALQIEERTLKQKLDSQFDTELGLEVEKTTSLLHKSLSNPNRNPEQKFCFQVQWIQRVMRGYVSLISSWTDFYLVGDHKVSGRGVGGALK